MSGKPHWHWQGNAVELSLVLEEALMHTKCLQLLAVVAALSGFTPSWVRAQTQLDISSCFNSLLQQQVDYTSDVRLALATLSQISESTYESSKHDASLAGQYKFLGGSINYADFNEKR